MPCRINILDLSSINSTYFISTLDCVELILINVLITSLAIRLQIFESSQNIDTEQMRIKEYRMIDTVTNLFSRFIFIMLLM